MLALQSSAQGSDHSQTHPLKPCVTSHNPDVPDMIERIKQRTRAEQTDDMHNLSVAIKDLESLC